MFDADLAAFAIAELMLSIELFCELKLLLFNVIVLFIEYFDLELTLFKFVDE